MGKDRTHAAAKIALIIGSAVLSFSFSFGISAPALAGVTPTAHRACHSHPHARRCQGPSPHRASRRHSPAGPHHQTTAPHASVPHHSAPQSRQANAPAATAPSPAASIASVLATTCQNTEVTPEPSNIGLVREAVMCLINRVRAEHSEQPLVANADLERAADEHSRELVELDYFAHVSPSGLTPVQRIRETGYIRGPEFGYVIGENLAWGTLNLSTPQSIVNAWIASPGHLANILEAQYKETGIGIVPSVPPSLGNDQAGATYAQEFGVLIE